MCPVGGARTLSRRDDRTQPGVLTPGAWGVNPRYQPKKPPPSQGASKSCSCSSRARKVGLVWRIVGVPRLSELHPVLGLGMLEGAPDDSFRRFVRRLVNEC